ncbi:MAG: hypothetical protein K2H56_01000, partial [Malacoplasma sp.]|nr:hypothetical protein [Malacoplasma sp.]
MKVIFIKENQKAENNIKLNNVFLSKNNPRFTLINSFQDNLLDFIKNKEYKNSQQKVFEKILFSEGDFSDLYNLLKSIKNNGFDNKSDEIFLIRDYENFVVAEGNRRMMCLKILDNVLKIPEFSLIKEKTKNYENENSEYINVYENENKEINDENIDDKTKENYSKCEKIIEEIKKEYKNKEIKVYVKIVDNQEDLWRYIYEKHLTGEKPGMRKWSRTKYFADLLNIFKDGILENSNIDNIYKYIRREPESVKNDFKEAQFIYSCIYFGEKKNLDYNNREEVENWNDYEILNKMVNSTKTSALERNHSYLKVKNEVIKFTKITGKLFDKKFFSISFNKENYRIKFLPNKLKTSDLLKFIYDKWREGIITTRPISEKNKPQFINDLNFLLIGITSIEKKLSEKDIDSINEFELTIDNLKKIIVTNKSNINKQKIDRFVYAKEIKENNKKFLDIKKNINFYDSARIEPIDVFTNLINQYDSIEDKYINAKSSTIRSILEQLVIWMWFYEYRKNESEFNEYLEKISTRPRIHDLFKKIRSKYFLVDDIKQFSITEIFNFYLSNLEEDKKNLLIENFIDILKYSKKAKKDIEEDIDDYIDNIILLNDYIHAYHRIYLVKEYNENLKKFKKIQSTIIEILE